MIRICQCGRLTGQRHCVYCGRGTPGQNAYPPPSPLSPRNSDSRQQWRRKTFSEAFRAVTEKNLYPVKRLGHFEGFFGMLRRDRRKLARAYTAGAVRQME